MHRASLAVMEAIIRPIVFLMIVGVVASIHAEEADPLAKLNGSFRRIYQRARAERLAAVGPVVISDFDELILLHKGQRTTLEYVPAAYHRLKAISHVPLAVYLVVATHEKPAEKLTADQAAELAALREQTVSARSSLDRFFAKDQLQRQQIILDAALAFVDRVLNDGRSSPDDAARFARGLIKPISANMNDAAKVQIDALHEQMMKWKKQMTGEEWNKLQVVILGSQMPRKDNLAAQYFAKLLSEPGEGKRIIYAEGLGEERKALNLLGTHLLDGELGQAFFGEPLRMHRDLLGDAAKEHLKTMSLD